MRHSLMKTFDDIYIFDLHGNTKKKETSPDGSKDENVFDIQQGVSIGIFVKKRKSLKKIAVVRHADLWGTRKSKYKVLLGKEVKSTKWQKLSPKYPYYLFKTQETGRLPEYESYYKIPDVFSPNGDPAPGIVTTQDEFAISWTKAEAVSKVERFLKTSNEEEARDLFRLCSQAQWVYERAKNELKNGQWRKQCSEILYRPFDIRWTVFNRNVAVHRRERVMRHMLAGTNIGIITTRQTRDKWDAFVSRNICTHKSCAAYDINSLFPLYLYPDPYENGELFSNGAIRHANINEIFINELSSKVKLSFLHDGRGDLKKPFGPEDIFDYIYAILHSPTYRSRYAEFLKMDFPRIPLISSKPLFRELCRLGEELVGLHLVEKSGPMITRYPVSGDDTVENVRYTEPGQGADEGRVWINKKQYFEGIPPTVWEFYVGGYQVCRKWLKDRKGRKLNFDDINHYQKVVAAISETMRIMNEIDVAIDKHGGWPIK
jgi:predicted helicase